MLSKASAQKFLLPVLTLAAVALSAHAFAANAGRVLQSSDTGWLVRSGEIILSTGRLPAHDIFSWTCQSCPWTLYQWLFSLTAAALFQYGGLWFVGLAVYIVLAIIYFVLLPKQWISLGIPTFIALAAAAATLNPYWFFARPQCVSYLLLVVFLSICERYRLEGKQGTLWLLPPLMVLWANFHSFWILGIAILALYTVDDLNLRLRGKSIRTDGKPYLLPAITLACLVCVLANPYGFGLITYLASFPQRADLETIGELEPITAYPLGVPLPLASYFVVGWLAMLFARDKVPFCGLTIAAAGTVMGMTCLRFLPVAAIATWPYFGLALAPYIKRLSFPGPGQTEGSPELKGMAGLRARALVALAIATASIAWTERFPDPQTTWLTHAYDVRAGLRFMKAHPQAGHLLNDATIGSNLILAGQLPVFIDTRFDLYGIAFFQDWYRCLSAEPGWQDFLEREKISRIAIGPLEPLRKELMASPGWLLAYDDGRLSYWLKATEENKALLSAWGVGPGGTTLRLLPSDDRPKVVANLTLKEIETGMTLLTSHKAAEAATHFQTALAFSPGNREAKAALVRALNGAQSPQGPEPHNN